MGRVILRCIAVPNSHDTGIVGVTIRACGQSENGAERAENRVSGTGVVNGHSRKRFSGSGAESGLNRPLKVRSHVTSKIIDLC